MHHANLRYCLTLSNKETRFTNRSDEIYFFAKEKADTRCNVVTVCKKRKEINNMHISKGLTKCNIIIVVVITGNAFKRLIVEPHTNIMEEISGHSV